MMLQNSDRDSHGALFEWHYSQVQQWKLSEVLPGFRFEEDIALQDRMSAIGDIIQEQDYPHFICFQV